MMNGWITKMAISLILRVGHTHETYHFKAINFLYLMIYYRLPPDLYQMRRKVKTIFFTFIFGSKISHLILHRSV